MMIDGYDVLQAFPGEHVSATAERARGAMIRYICHNGRVYQVNSDKYTLTAARRVIVTTKCGYCGYDLGQLNCQYHTCPKCGDDES